MAGAYVHTLAGAAGVAGAAGAWFIRTPLHSAVNWPVFVIYNIHRNEKWYVMLAIYSINVNIHLGSSGSYLGPLCLRSTL